MDRTLARGLTLTILAFLAGIGLAVLVGPAHADPEPRSAPTATLLASWTLAMFAVPLLAIAAARAMPEPPARAAAAAFWSAVAFAIAVGILTPALAFTSEDFAVFTTMDWLGTVGRGVAGAGGLAALAAAGAWALAARYLASSRLASSSSIPPPPQLVAEPTPRVPLREPDPEALAIAQRRLAMGELTRHDYDELLRRLRE